MSCTVYQPTVGGERETPCTVADSVAAHCLLRAGLCVFVRLHVHTVHHSGVRSWVTYERGWSGVVMTA